MSWYMYEPRSKIDDYDENDDDNQSLWGFSDILMFPLMVIGMFCLELFFILGLFIYYLSDVYKTTKTTIKTGEISYPFLAQVGIFAIIIWLCVYLYPPADIDIDLIPSHANCQCVCLQPHFLPYAAVFIYKLRRFFGAEVA